MKIAVTDTMPAENSEIPSQIYRVRIIGTSLKSSSSGNPMTTLIGEIIEPDKVEIDGQLRNVAGRQFQLYLMHVPDKAWGQGTVLQFCGRLGLDVGEFYDTELHSEYFLGMEFDMPISCERDIKRFERKPGEKLGQPMLDGEGNEILVGYRLNGQVREVPVFCKPVRNDSIVF